MRLTKVEDGFTLVEMIIAMLIIGIISVPLGNVVLGFLRNTNATTARLTESHDAQISAAYWGRDVASIGTRSTMSPYLLQPSVETGVPNNSGLYPCGAGTANAIVRLAYDDFTAAGVATLVRVAYVVQTVSGQTELHRLRCQGSGVVVSHITLAHDLDPSTPPTVVCLVATTPTPCDAAPLVPTTVNLTLTIKDPNNLHGAWSVQLTGQRRQS